jgi:tetratricopeptide (TPR) repeat protein
MYMNLQGVNFEDLKSDYFERTGGKEALKFFVEVTKTWKPMQLGRLLRYHSPVGVYEDEEKKRRGEMDDLLNGCSVVEIAVQIGFIAPPDGQEFWLALRQILENRQVEKFFAKHYPLPLPQLMQLRLKGANLNCLRPTADRTASFMEFLALDQRFQRNHNNNDLDQVMFLDLLDDFYVEDYDFDSFVRDLKQPSKLVQAVLLPPAKRNFSQRMLNEFTLFIQFCFDLYAVLSRLNNQPLLQSAIWSHYSYWFQIIGEELHEQLGKALEKFLDWKPPTGNRETASQIQQYVREAGAVLSDLTSQRYAGPIQEILRDVTRANGMPIQFVLYKDTDGRYTFANEPFCQRVRLPIDALIGKTDLEVVSQNVARSRRDDDFEIIAGRKAQIRIDEKHETAEGETVYYSGIKTPLYGAEKHIIGVRYEFEDITNKVSGVLQKPLKVAKPFTVKSGQVGKLLADAQAFYALGKYDEAIDTYKKVLKERPNHTDALFQLGSALIAERQFEDAITIFEKLLSLPSAPIKAWKLLGYAYLFYPEDTPDRIDKLNRSIEVSQKYLGFEPSDVGAQLNLACAYGKLGSMSNTVIDTVIDLLKKVITANPEAVNQIRSLTAKGGDFEKWATVKEFMALIEQ